MLFFALSLFNFIIIYGSIFYILSLKITLRRVIFCLLANVIISLSAFSFQDSLWISMILSIILSGLLLYLISKDYLVFHHLFVIHIVSILSEYTTLYIMGFFHLSIHVDSFTAAILFALLIIVQIAIFAFMYKRILNRYQRDIHLSQASKTVLLFIVGITFFVFYALIFIPAEQGDIDISILNLALLVFYFLIMIGLTRIVFHTILKENQVHLKTVEQQQFTEYMHALEQVNRDMQSFRHDYANILLSIRGYIETEDLNGLRTYFHEQIVKVEEQTISKNYAFSQIDKLSIIELKGLLATKLLAAEAHSVPVNIEIPDRLDFIAMEIIDLTRVIGIFLDNAIEASNEVSEPQINIAFFSRKTEVIIVIENRIMNSELTINDLFREHYSTKGANRGVGLSNAKNILSTYSNVTFNSRMEDHWFIQEVIIKESHEIESYHMRR